MSSWQGKELEELMYKMFVAYGFAMRWK